LTGDRDVAQGVVVGEIGVREVGGFDEQALEKLLRLGVGESTGVDVVTVVRVHPLVETSDAATAAQHSGELYELEGRVERGWFAGRQFIANC